MSVLWLKRPDSEFGRRVERVIPYVMLLVGVGMVANGLFNKTGELINRPANLPRPVQRVLAIGMGLLFIGAGLLILHLHIF